MQTLSILNYLVFFCFCFCFFFLYQATNSQNWGVENGKWQVNFSEIIWLIFAQNLGQFYHVFNKMLGKLIFYLLFLQIVPLFAFWGHTFAVLMPFSAFQCEKMPAERPFSLFTSGDSVFLEHCRNSLDFPILIFFFSEKWQILVCLYCFW